jgi:hypothetical protein
MPTRELEKYTMTDLILVAMLNNFHVGLGYTCNILKFPSTSKYGNILNGTATEKMP